MPDNQDERQKRHKPQQRTMLLPYRHGVAPTIIAIPFLVPSRDALPPEIHRAVIQSKRQVRYPLHGPMTPRVQEDSDDIANTRAAN
jgi:hypothetical protein